MALRADNAQGQFFMNAADTTTKGVDIVARLDHSFADSSALRLVLAGTINETEITDVNLPSGLPGSLFTDQDRSIVEEWQPKDRFSLLGYLFKRSGVSSARGSPLRRVYGP